MTIANGYNRVAYRHTFIFFYGKFISVDINVHYGLALGSFLEKVVSQRTVGIQIYYCRIVSAVRHFWLAWQLIGSHTGKCIMSSLDFVPGFICFPWALIIYAIVRHQLFNRKIFVSRKVVYASVAPISFGIYLMLIGVITFIMKTFNLPFPVVLRWFFIVFGIVMICLASVSGKVRHSIKYYVSTHFYINKYEYRDEWLHFSKLLQGAISEAEIVDCAAPGFK